MSELLLVVEGFAPCSFDLRLLPCRHVLTDLIPQSPYDMFSQGRLYIRGLAPVSGLWVEFTAID